MNLKISISPSSFSFSFFLSLPLHFQEHQKNVLYLTTTQYKGWHSPPSECTKERLGRKKKEIFNNKYWIIALKASLSLMEVQFGDRPKPPYSLWHMIKICFVLLICSSQITTLLLALQTQPLQLPLNYCTTSPPFFFFFYSASNQEGVTHNLAEKLCLQTWRQKVPFKVSLLTPHPHPCHNAAPQKYISLEVWEHRR